jgi:hypothetical protein
VSCQTDSEFQSDQTGETDLTEPDSDSLRQPEKRRKAGPVTVVLNLSLQQIAAQYGDDPPDDSKVNLSDIPEDYDKSKKTIVRRDRIEERWWRSVAPFFVLLPRPTVILTKLKILYGKSQERARRGQMAGSRASSPSSIE